VTKIVAHFVGKRKVWSVRPISDNNPAVASERAPEGSQANTVVDLDTLDLVFVFGWDRGFPGVTVDRDGSGRAPLGVAPELGRYRHVDIGTDFVRSLVEARATAAGQHERSEDPPLHEFQPGTGSFPNRSSRSRTCCCRSSASPAALRASKSAKSTTPDAASPRQKLKHDAVKTAS
jgi:hypothetical protein